MREASQSPQAQALLAPLPGKEIILCLKLSDVEQSQ